jgi:hypothetical protein
MGAGAADGVCATVAVPAAGSRRVVPERTHESGFSPFAAASVAVETPWRAAIAPSESPGRTT